MKFDFESKNPLTERIIFVLSLDRKKNKERIIIGLENEVQLLLETGIGDVYFDNYRKLGQLLIEFENDSLHDWDNNLQKLTESYNILFDTLRFSKTKQQKDFLLQKYEKGEPSAMYAAMRMWNEYLFNFKVRHGKDIFLESLGLLFRPFYKYNESKIWQETAIDVSANAYSTEETKLEIRYPCTKHSLECVVAYSSFQPLLFYYLKRLEEWKLSFQQCKICKNYFLAKSKSYELCSEKCRSVQATENKRQFDERAKDNPAEHGYKLSYDYWYNRMKKLRKNTATSPVRLAAAEKAFVEFRAEAARKKITVRKDKEKVSEFLNWLFEQQRVIDGFMEDS